MVSAPRGSSATALREWRSSWNSSWRASRTYRDDQAGGRDAPGSVSVGALPKLKSSRSRMRYALLPSSLSILSTDPSTSHARRGIVRPPRYLPMNVAVQTESETTQRLLCARNSWRRGSRFLWNWFRETEGFPSLSPGSGFVSLAVMAAPRFDERSADAKAKKVDLMSWSRRFPTCLHLNDGRTLSTLAQARDLVLDLPQQDQANPHWTSAGEFLVQGAYRNRQTPIFDVRTQFSRALQADGLI